MPTIKPALEKIEPEIGSSFKVREFRETASSEHPYWHFHPEYEIVYISSGRGKRHIGDHISYFEDGDLIFLGPDLPHFGFTEAMKEGRVEIVVQMREDFMGEHFLNRPELQSVRALFERSRQGLSFFGNTRERVGPNLRRLPALAPLDRLLCLLDVLRELAASDEYALLGARGFAMPPDLRDQERMRTVYGFVEANFQTAFTLEDVASGVNMSVSAFCRYFKKLTHRTFMDLVNEWRITHASRQLVQHPDRSITEIAFDSGFNNLSHFNRQFRLRMGMSPSEYRVKWRHL